jgi:hypothetical protein
MNILIKIWYYIINKKINELPEELPSGEKIQEEVIIIQKDIGIKNIKIKSIKFKE